MLKKNKLLILFIFFLLAFYTYKQQSKPKLEPSFSLESLNCTDCNIILIGIDTLGTNHMSVYGYERKTTPFMDELAKKSIKFNNHYSQIPYTPPSFWSIMTGLYPHTHNLPKADNIFPNPEEVNEPSIFEDVDRIRAEKIDPNLAVLPRVLKKNGYKTKGIISFLNLYSLESVFDNFEFFDEETESSTGEAFYQTTNQAIDWLEKNNDQKFFMFLHYWDTHQPYTPVKEFDIFTPDDSNDRFQSNAAKYDGEVLFVDHKIEILFDKLEELKLNENTIVIITSDHGEQFGEKNCGYFLKEAEQCEFHSISLYEEEIHTPLIIYLPHNQGAKEIDQISQSIDIMPTIFDLVGLPSIDQLEGESLLPVIRGEKNQNKTAFSELSQYTSFADVTSIRKENWKLINIYRDDEAIQLLYDLDQGENKNYISEQPQLVQELTNLIFEVTQGERFTQIDQSELDQNTLLMLKSLGYIK